MRTAIAALILLLASPAFAKTEVGRWWMDHVGYLHVLVVEKNDSGFAWTTTRIRVQRLGAQWHTRRARCRYLQAPLPIGGTRPAEVYVQLNGASFDTITCEGFYKE